jgi:hypothetical protein
MKELIPRTHANLRISFLLVVPKIKAKACAIANLFFSCSSKDQSKTFVGGIGLEEFFRSKQILNGIIGL